MLFSFAVAGESLRKILDGGVREGMEQAMMFLIQKATTGAVDKQKDGPYKPSHSVSIELVDEQGARIVEEAEKDVEDPGTTELACRKRSRTGNPMTNQPRAAEASPGADGGVVNRTIIVVRNRAIMTPTIDPRRSKDVVGVEIHPHERWVGGATIPLRAFQVFNLPQDAS